MLKGLMIAGAFCLASAAANAATIDFNAVGGGDLSGTNFGGATITAGTSQVFGSVTPNGTTGLLAFDPLCGCYPSPFTAVFDTAVTDVSVDLGDFNQDSDSLFLYAYDAANVLVDSFLLAIDAAFVGMETLSVSATSISYVVFGGIGLNGENNVYADNLTFNNVTVAPVPVPAAGLMMLGGLGLLVGLRRRARG
jgi:hypothetical protein